MSLWILISLILCLTGCAVEVGNAGGKKKAETEDQGPGKLGKVKILFIQEQGIGNESLVLDLQSFKLFSKKGLQSTTLDPLVDKVDILVAEKSKILVAKSYEVPVGKYKKLMVQLAENDPILYRDSDGVIRSVSVTEGTASSFELSEHIEVKEGEVTPVVIRLARFHSIYEEGANKKVIISPTISVGTNSESVEAKDWKKIDSMKSKGWKSPKSGTKEEGESVVVPAEETEAGDSDGDDGSELDIVFDAA